jgi:iron(III) transport system permease protein
VTVLLAILLSYTVRTKNTPLITGLVRFASIGYAMPGTIIALGIFLPLARFDNFVDFHMNAWFGISSGLLITGSGATLVYAYVVRFMVIAEGSIDGGFKKISPNLDMAAYCYGRGRMQTLQYILLPLLRPAIATAALLVFIDSLKELSATLMLRPFGVETLAIYIHDLASRGRIEQASVASLIIMIVGVIPVIILARTTLRDP